MISLTTSKAQEKKKSKEERDIINKYRPFARFISQVSIKIALW
jgi:hypothetical protein